MAMFKSRFAISIVLIVAAGFLGCSSPTPNPVVPSSQFRDGTPLDMSADFISRSGSPYILEEDWVIEEGRTVTIEEGTVIMMAGRNWIDIDGKLIAHGSAAMPIHFTSANTVTDFGQWRGLKFDNPSDPSELSYCIFSYGAFFDTDTLTERGRDAQHYRGMLGIRNSSPIIRHSICYYNQNNGVYVEGENAAPSIRYCIFTENDASGVRADTSVVFPWMGGDIDISYNSVAENSAPPFIMGLDTLYYGVYARINNNIDSCDTYYNIDLPAQLTDPMASPWADFSDFSLQSCSPCVDAGPFGEAFIDPDPDGTIADMGAVYYQRQTAELRGRAEGTLDPVTYTLSCNIVVPGGMTLTIPAGCRIEANGIYTIRVLGQLDIQGTVDNRVVICPCAINDGDQLWSGITFENREGSAASVIRYADIEGYDRLDVRKPGTIFENVRFIDGFSYGMDIATGTLEEGGEVSLANCEFTNTGAFAIQADSSRLSIRNTKINGTKGRGIALYYVYDAVEIYNTVVNACSTTALFMESSCNPTVINNVFSNCGYYGMDIADNCNPLFVNNIVTGNGRGGLRASRVCAPTLNYNDVFGNGMRNGSDNLNYINAGTGGTFLIAENSLETDPLLNPDFTLAGGSPCIDAGHPDILDGNGTRSDMGAFGGPGGGLIGAFSAGPYTVYMNR